ncbi:MAG: polysaccharide biosynthesis protein [Candidatus Liptonbacteria bacterium]|nr:polysaccharide biosynthesis protein [Candidatus Liptonbacteria bacterium]
MRRHLNALIRRKGPLFLAADVVAIFASLFFAFLIRFDGTFPGEYREKFFLFSAALLLPTVFFVWRRGLYAFNWRFVGIHELLNLFNAVSLGSAAFAAIVFLDRDTTNAFTGFPRSVIVISYAFNLIFLGGIRISKRAWLEFARGVLPPAGDPTLIVGAGRQGEHLVRHLQATQNIYRLVGIADDTPENRGISIHDVPVVGSIADIPTIAEREGVRHIIIAFERDHAALIRETVRVAREANIADIRIVPEFSELLGQKLSFRDLKEVSVEDLLGRDPAKIDTQEIKSFIHGKIVMVTGAAGSIGSELCRQISQFLPSKLVILDFNESGIFDIENELRRSFPNAEFQAVIANTADRDKIDALVGEYRPEVVFHAAAYKHVPLMEYHPEEAARINILGTLNVAQAAVKHNVGKFVLISTDKAVKPISVMGKTKRIAEFIIKDLNESGPTRFVAVRFGNVLASRGSVIPVFQEQIRHGGPVTVTHPDMTRYFMTIPEAVLLVMEAGAIGKGGEIFLLDMGKPVKIIDLARELITLSGHTPDVDIPITITGIRPGEKIFEELLTAEEGSSATKWEKIFISKTQSHLTHERLLAHLHAAQNLFERGAPSRNAALAAIEAFFTAK